MKILPQKNEVAAVVAILEDGSYESPLDMGRAIVKAVVEQVALRETYAVAHNDAPFEFFWPFYYEADARRFNDAHKALPGTECFLLKMRSPTRDAATQQKHDQEAKDRTKHLNWPTESQSLTGRNS